MTSCVDTGQWGRMNLLPGDGGLPSHSHTLLCLLLLVTTTLSMVYIDPEELGWRPIVRTWLATRASEHIPAGLLPHLEELFDKHVDSGLHFVRRSCKFDVETVDINLVQSLCDLFMSLMVSDAMQPLKYSESDMETTKRSQRLINLMFVFSYVWALGGNCNTQTQDSFDSFCQQQFESFGLPVTGTDRSSPCGFFLLFFLVFPPLSTRGCHFSFASSE